MSDKPMSDIDVGLQIKLFKHLLERVPEVDIIDAINCRLWAVHDIMPDRDRLLAEAAATDDDLEVEFPGFMIKQLLPDNFEMSKVNKKQAIQIVVDKLKGDVEREIKPTITRWCRSKRDGSFTLHFSMTNVAAYLENAHELLAAHLGITLEEMKERSRITTQALWQHTPLTSTQQMESISIRALLVAQQGFDFSSPVKAMEEDIEDKLDALIKYGYRTSMDDGWRDFWANPENAGKLPENAWRLAVFGIEVSQVLKAVGLPDDERGRAALRSSLDVYFARITKAVEKARQLSDKDDVIPLLQRWEEEEGDIRIFFCFQVYLLFENSGALDQPPSKLMLIGMSKEHLARTQMMMGPNGGVSLNN